MAANDNHCSHAVSGHRLLGEDPQEPFIESLPFASQFAIWAARAWVTALKQEQSFETVSGDTFSRFDLHGAQAALDEFFLVVAHAAGRQIDIRCLKCRYVSLDEMVFHQALAATQNGLAFQAYNELRHWLAPAAARIAFAALARLGESLARGKLRLATYGRPVAWLAPPASLAAPDLPMPSHSLH